MHQGTFRNESSGVHPRRALASEYRSTQSPSVKAIVAERMRVRTKRLAGPKVRVFVGALRVSAATK